MATLVSPGAIDAILALVLLELVGIGLLLVRVGAPQWVAPFSLHLAAGAGLLLALRASLAGAAPHWIALALGASFVSHGLSLWGSYRVLARPGPEGAGRAFDSPSQRS